MKYSAGPRVCAHTQTELTIRTCEQTAMRGMTGSGDGVHILTGPIHVEGAEPGDVLKVEILELYPRKNPNGESYGVNVRRSFSLCNFFDCTQPVHQRTISSIYQITFHVL